MATVVWANTRNGLTAHYYANSGERCHVSIVAGGFVEVDGSPTETDLIQLDAVNLGAIVPLERTAVSYDPDAASNDTWHWMRDCARS